jgi:hypothetical protein
MQSGIYSRRLYKPALYCVSLLLFSLSAMAQDGAAKAPVMPDAQIEANVLKALAGAPQLADEKITTTTVYGEVTLSGSVKDEPTRALAETLASQAAGVKKVVDELTLSSDGSTANSQNRQDDATQASNQDSQSRGTMAASAPPYEREAQDANQQGGANQGNSAGRSSQYPPPAPGRRGYGPPPASYDEATQPYGAQRGGRPVLVPSGALVRVRINQGLDSKHAVNGATFDAVVLNDVVADGAVAIPRGASVQGSVVDVKTSGALSGRGELSLQLNQVVLAGKVFPIVSDKWSSVGADKTIHTVNNTVGLGAMGALIGAVAGGGPGAAIGAGAGAAAGLGTSAASGGGHALIPPEAILTFHLTQPAQVMTVSQAEMDRLAYGVPVGAQQPRLVRRLPPPGYCCGPGYYYPGYYPRPIYYPYPY